MVKMRRHERWKVEERDAWSLSVMGNGHKFKPVQLWAFRKDQAGRGNNNRQIAKIYTYIPIHERIHMCWKNLQTVLAVMERGATGTVKAPNSLQPHHQGDRRRLLFVLI